jgi:uncharacterized delta-60 repeat protein
MSERFRFRFRLWSPWMVGMVILAFGGLGCSRLSSDTRVGDLQSYDPSPWLVQLGQATRAIVGGNVGDDSCEAVAADADGNVYCGGSTDGALGEANGGGEDAFVAKLSATGKVLWITQLGAVTHSPGGNNSGDDSCQSVAVDPSGNVFCAGRTSGSLGEANAGQKDVFVMKLSPSGSLLWLKQLGLTSVGGSASGLDSCYSIAVDGSGSVYCAGSTTGSLGESNGGQSDVVVVKVSSGGQLLWITQFGAVTYIPGQSNSGVDYAYGLAVDPSGNVYCGGSTTGSMGETNGGSYDVFVCKLNSNGQLQWLKQLGTITYASGGNNSGLDNISGLALDAEGNVFASGSTTGPIGGITTTGDGFILKMNSSGNLLWVTQVNAAGTSLGGDVSGTESLYDITTDSSGSVYSVGYTTGALGEAHGGGAVDLFVMKLGPNGNAEWITQLGASTHPNGGGNGAYEECYGIAVNSRGNVFCAGATDGSTGEANGGARDVFVLKLTSSGKLN